MVDKDRGEADDYYNEGQQPPPQQNQPYYGQPPPQNQQQQQQWAPPPNYESPQKNYQPGEQFQFNEAFKVSKPKFNDLWAGILLILVFGGFVAVSAISISGYSSTKSINGGGIYDGTTNNFGLSTNTIVLFAFVLALATVFSYAYVWMARLFPKVFIWVTGILNIVFGFVLAIYMFTRKSYGGAIVFLIFACFTLFCFFTWIPRIPFSAFMLRTSIDVSKRYGHTYLVSFIGGLLGVAFAAWYSVTLVAIYSKYQPGGNNTNCDAGGCSQAKVIGLIVFITFAMYWISEWLKNTIHTTIAGVYGSWYFYQGSSNGKGATRGSLKRALTYSFGSISLGSLIVAIINLIRQICSVAQQQAGANGNIAAEIAFCVLQCIIGIIDWVVEFVNRYAYVYCVL
jgi:hypothetical protein